MARSPKWHSDELILALDLYFQFDSIPSVKDHPKIFQLSEILNRLPIHQVRPDQEKFRNPNGVYMKLCKFLRFDPEYPGVGLKAGGNLEGELWDKYYENRQELRKLAKAIISVILIYRGRHGTAT